MNWSLISCLCSLEQFDKTSIMVFSSVPGIKVQTFSLYHLLYSHPSALHDSYTHMMWLIIIFVVVKKYIIIIILSVHLLYSKTKVAPIDAQYNLSVPNFKSCPCWSSHMIWSADATLFHKVSNFQKNRICHMFQDRAI